ncbi:MAG: uroporphyrinogen-III C-methyltransferase [Eubacteriales bacterium]|nr:uroporphyrinogen-III C-methyltransferase [Eubacteriales bacterium]
MRGFVTLLGAGPGDPGLLTVKGRQALEQAEVVVYDALVGREILEMMPPAAEKIDVGKRASHHTMAQEDINRLLLEKARAGKQVVRLKGGDPFLFGRGGEELELLSREGIPFQVIPGITSAIAVPAYGGIPVTHRDCASSLHIITGHARAGRELDIDFEALVRTGGTLVFLMGVTSLAAICRGLTAAGMDPDTPAAIVQQGTTPGQRRVNATAATLAEKAQAAGIQAPAISIFGSVCAWADSFDWFDRLPLKGRSILVTRPRDRAGTLSQRLRALGAAATEYPCIETRPIVPCPAMEQALKDIGDYRWLAFTSPAGVEAFWACLRGLGLDARQLGGIRLAAIGSGTARALSGHGLEADLVPPVYDAAHLGQALAERAEGPVLILRAREGSPALTAALERAGVPFRDIPVYDTVYDNPRSAALRAALDRGELEFVTFTSASTVKGFVSTVGPDGDFSTITGLCIGAQTAAEAQRCGIPVKIAENATIDALVTLAQEVCL